MTTLIFQCTRCCAQSSLPPRKCPACGSKAFGTLNVDQPSRRDLLAAEAAAQLEQPSFFPSWAVLVPLDALSDGARPAAPAAEAAELGGVKCGEQGCERSATHKFFWPSPDLPPTRFACEEHATRAGEISATLGFDADPQPL